MADSYYPASDFDEEDQDEEDQMMEAFRISGDLPDDETGSGEEAEEEEDDDETPDYMQGMMSQLHSMGKVLDRLNLGPATSTPYLAPGLPSVAPISIPGLASHQPNQVGNPISIQPSSRFAVTAPGPQLPASILPANGVQPRLPFPAVPTPVIVAGIPPMPQLMPRLVPVIPVGLATPSVATPSRFQVVGGTTPTKIAAPALPPHLQATATPNRLLAPALPAHLTTPPKPISIPLPIAPIGIVGMKPLGASVPIPAPIGAIGTFSVPPPAVPTAFSPSRAPLQMPTINFPAQPIQPTLPMATSATGMPSISIPTLPSTGGMLKAPTLPVLPSTLVTPIAVPYTSLLKQEVGETAPAYQARQKVAELVAKTTIATQAGPRQLDGETIVQLSKAIVSKYWLNLDYDRTLEDTIKVVVANSVELSSLLTRARSL